MSSELAVSVLIGASVRAGFATVFGRAKNTVKELGGEIQKTRATQEKLGKSIAKGVATGRSGLGVLRERYDLLGKAIEKAGVAQGRLNKAIKAQESSKQRRADIRAEMAEAGGHAAVAAAPIIASVKKFMAQENASADLKIAMMRNDGSFGKFKEIDRLTTEWGAALPGNKTDFSKMALGLKSQGISDDTIINGGGLATAQLNVVMDIPIADGSFFAKNMEAHGIKESELLKSADLTQRAYFAAGLKKEDMFEAMKYYAGKANTLGYTGLEHQKRIYAVEGMAATKGIEGSQFGTNFSTFLGNLSKGVGNMEYADKGRKGDLRRMMESVGAKFDFFNPDGSIKDLRTITGILESEFAKIKAKYGEKGVMDISNAMFGSEGGRVADILIQSGIKGFDEMIAKMDAQASLSDRIKVKTSTLSSALESLGGAAENTAAVFGSVFGADIKSAAQTLQGLVENGLQPFLEHNKETIKWVVGLAAGFFAAKLGILALAYGASMFLMPFRALATSAFKAQAAFRLFQLMRLGQIGKGVMVLRMFGMSAASAAKMAGLLGKGFGLLKTVFSVFSSGVMTTIRFLPMLASGFLKLGMALMANPIFLALGLLAAAAYLLYTNWEGVVGGAKALWQDLGNFFGSLWTSVTTAFQTAWSGLTTWFSVVWLNITTLLSAVWESIKTTVSTAWESIKAFFSTGIAALLNLILTFSPVTAFMTAFQAVWTWFSGLGATFMSYGSMMIDGLVNGIKAGIGRVVGAIQNVVSMAKSAFTSDRKGMGIHSPSRVFAGYGGYMTEGLAVGIKRTAGRPLQTVGAWAGRLKERFGSRLGSLRADLAARISDSVADFAATREQQAQAAAGAGGITVNFNPTIHAPGGDPAQIQTALQMGLREFETLFNRMMADRERRAY
ncbi:phage tail tape measure protein [Neisseria chenwenguii]|uniref:phage tail tape measure protein n=1 Tax=Neisseria chenwenguii TaxID=1853278 RepID=UPI000F4F53F7|nr:phage tail tape measure protein [Neisseria chenwenguii]ROV57147.1 phage tail tape measure protein [Neisseria chenwenguii]